MGNVEQIKVQILPDGRMHVRDAAKYLGMSAGTLARWRVNGMGPEYTLVGCRIFYFQQALDNFISGDVK